MAKTKKSKRARRGAARPAPRPQDFAPRDRGVAPRQRGPAALDPGSARDPGSTARDQDFVPPDDRILASDLTLHELFRQQTTAMLERADLSDEAKQAILIGISCPCCGAGGFSFTAKLRR